MANETKHSKGELIFKDLESCLQAWEGIPDYQKKYARLIIEACQFHGYDQSIDKETMYKFLEKADKENKRVIVKPDNEFLPGGTKADQCDGWTYHLELIEKNDYTDEEEYWSTGGSTGKLPSRITPNRINSLLEDEIFVFGSNAKGMHMGGAARIAYDKFGAEWGNGEGLQGHSYALPTMEGTENTRAAIKRFTEFAYDHPDLTFFVTAVGCGIAGYTPEDIAPIFESAAHLENVYLPLSFWKILTNK